MTGGTPASAAEGNDAAPARTSGALLASLALSVLTLLVPHLGPLGPLGAGVLAFLGYRKVRASGGRVRSRGLAILAMSLSLVLLGIQGWTAVRNAPSAAAWAAIRGRVAEVESALRSGTAESAWECLSEEARRGHDHDAFVADLRRTAANLGPLVALEGAESRGGDWERTAEFNENEAIELHLPMRFDARFQRGRGTVELEFLARRAAGTVTVDLVRLRVLP